ncbi:MAG: UDP binding domain-containing protein, partial [candidate division Zixibacteria bacterium]|nr:UDP binding domain-containing protein [candidate division Zixibacteria bacterium]
AGYDPAGMDESRKELPSITYATDAYAACKDADLVLLMTEWNEFRDLDFKRIKSIVRTPNLFDTRNVYDPRALRKIGFTYICTGRP